MNTLDALLGRSIQDLMTASWREPAASLVNGLALQAQRRVVATPDAFHVAGADQAWLVLSGHLDLFLLRGVRRHFLCQIPPGSLLDAARDGPDGVLLAVPAGQAELVAIRRSVLAALPVDRDLRRHRDQAWADWFRTVQAIAGVDAPAPDPADADAVHTLYAAMIDGLVERIRLRERQASSVRSEQAREASHALGRVLHDLVAVLPGQDPSPVPARAPLLQACTQVSLALGLTQEDVPKIVATAGSDVEAIELFCQEARLQFAIVRLAGAWWRRQQGPLLVFGPDRRPLAALPAGANRYVMFDPADGSSVRLDARRAAWLSEDAVVLYAPLPHPAQAGQTVRPARIARFAALRHGRDLWAILLTILIGGILSLIPPIVTGWVMDPIIATADLAQVLVATLLLLGCGLSIVTVRAVQSIAMLRLEGAMDNRLQAAVWNRLLNLPVGFFADFTAGDLASRAASVNAMRRTLSNAWGTTASSIATALFSLGLMAWYDWRFALAIALLSVLFGTVMWLVGREVLRRNQEVMDYSGVLQGLMLQLLTAVTKLRVAGAERRAFVNWAELYRKSAAAGFYRSRLNLRLMVIRTLFGFVVPLVIIVIVGLQSGRLFAIFETVRDWSDISGDALAHTISAAHFVSFNVAMAQFLAAVFGLTRSALRVASVHPLYNRMHPILTAEEEPVRGFERLTAVKGAVEIVNLRFRYGGDRAAMVLDGVSLSARAGEFVAIVGPSGAGKSSLVRLLLGFEMAEAGSIFIDGNDTRRVSQRELRRHMGVVLQNGRLLAGSIRDNISAGRVLSDEQVLDAARIAGLEPMLATLPMGLETILGSGAADLSGGERQRLMIARAVARRPPILILDEATSALDNATQQAVSEGLAALRCTRIVVAHRLSTIRAADRIFVLSAGRIVETGTFDSLIMQGGLFKRLVDRQQAGS
jgi:ATP-binding cassette subfamily C protein